MKKIDFHMHTVRTFSDAAFDFSLDSLTRYVDVAALDAIAITNHDIFDLHQFNEITWSLEIPVYPGIEINFEGGHLLLIGEITNLEDFKAKADQVSAKIRSAHDSISTEELIHIYGDLSNYLLIPHYDKRPSLRQEVIDNLSNYISAGEVSSAKKFIYAANDDTGLTPVLFSDARMREGMSNFPARQTYIDCGDLTLNAIKQCLLQGKAYLSRDDGNALQPVFEDGQMMSTGLNVVLGARSSGKTVTLNKLNDRIENAKYIRQFDLVQQDESACKEAFEADVRTKRSEYSERYLSGFKMVVDDVAHIDLRENRREIDAYVTSLLKSAEHAGRQDSYANAALFNATKFHDIDDSNLKRLIDSVINIIENVDYKDTIEKHIKLDSIRSLVIELIEQLRANAKERQKKRFVNSILSEVKTNLRRRTSAVAVEDVDLYKSAMDKKRVARFEEIVSFLNVEKIINTESVQGFTVVAKKKLLSNATEAKKAISTQCSLVEAFKHYRNPYEYLQVLLDIGELPSTELYKLFTSINYHILNRDGVAVSGGERSEFRLLQKIKDAHSYDILLIDEPESSFDNGFLNSDVNQIIRDIASTMPVVVVTHNSTVGASINADYLVYASKEIENGELIYRLYSGHPTDGELYSVDGRSKNNHTVMMDSLEAGEDCYIDRRDGYEAIKNK